MSTSALDSDERDEYESVNELRGLLVAYKDDQLNDCVKSALEGKSRVRYKCMDTYSSFLAFGTTSGAIYLYRLTPITHTACTLLSQYPCDQGSIEVIRFLPNHRSDDLLIAIGTSRGSLVVFRLNQISGDHSPLWKEIYKAESFSDNSSIKLIEHDQDLFDTASSFNKLYICDAANRLYVLDSSTIYSVKTSLRGVFNSVCPPSVIFKVKGVKINQISAHRSQLLISTDETTRLFNEQTNQINVIGQKKRKDLDFYGACFFNPQYKPLRTLQVQQSNQQVNYPSNLSLNDSENLRIFVARPLFRLWQVDDQKSVKCTHQFEPLIRCFRFDQTIELDNEPVRNLEEDIRDSHLMMENFIESKAGNQMKLRSDHFRKLTPIHSTTLGNMLLSYTDNEIFIIDPIGAQLIACLSQIEPIVQVCCNENELYIWSSTTQGDQKQFHLRRLVLLDPTQFVLELHRVHRYMTMILFVQQFADLFRERMALPLHGKATITTVGGLLRNVLLNAWDMCKSDNLNDNDIDSNIGQDSTFGEFRRIVSEIIEECNQLRQSLTNLTDSRFFLSMTNENIDRLCSEPYASLVSLDVSIKDLHTNHVIHFSKDALNRHNSIANLSQNIQKLRSSTNISQTTRSNYDLSRPNNHLQPAFNNSLQKLNDKKVIVERKVSNRRSKALNASVKAGINVQSTNSDNGKGRATTQVEVENKSSVTFSSKLLQEEPIVECEDAIDEFQNKEVTNPPSSEDEEETSCFHRCPTCQWPCAKSHIRKLNLKQRDQLSWIENNLLGNFEEYIDEIQDKTFEYGLWRLYLKCLAFKNQLDDYVTCCIMLDDVRLLNVEQFVVTRHGQDEIIDRLLQHLSRKTITTRAQKGSGDVTSEDFCFRCSSELKKTSTDLTNGESQLPDKRPVFNAADDEYSFNLANLLEQFMMKRNADVKKVISRLLRHPKLLSESRLPATFYLKAIKTVALASSQSQLSRARLTQMRGLTSKVS